MEKVSDVWTVVYKETYKDPMAFSYSSGKEASQLKSMIDSSHGGELIDEHGEYAGNFELEWCYLINGKMVELKN